MGGDKRCYTLIIAPATNSQFYKLVFRRWHMYLMFLGALLYVTFQVTLTLGYYRVQMENRTLRQQHAAVLEELQTRLTSIEAESDRLRRLAGEMGLNLDVALESAPGESVDGIGGPSELGSFASELDRVASNLKLLRENLHAEKERTTPIGWPAHGHVSSGYGLRRNPFGQGYEFHAGVDIASGYGRTVTATADGVVIYVGYRGGYGKLIVIDHGRGLRTFYGHLSRVYVKVGDSVRRGGRLGRVGRTGRSTGAHVHYEIRIKDKPVNPGELIVSQREENLDDEVNPIPDDKDER